MSLALLHVPNIPSFLRVRLAVRRGPRGRVQSVTQTRAGRRTAEGSLGIVTSLKGKTIETEQENTVDPILLPEQKAS